MTNTTLASDTIKAKLNAFLIPLTNEERLRSIFFVSRKDSLAVDDALDAGAYGDGLHDEHIKKGLLAAFPLYLGVIVVWYAAATEVKSFGNLSKDELLFVIDNQKRQINSLYEHRQRL